MGLVVNRIAFLLAVSVCGLHAAGLDSLDVLDYELEITEEFTAGNQSPAADQPSDVKSPALGPSEPANSKSTGPKLLTTPPRITLRTKPQQPGVQPNTPPASKPAPGAPLVPGQRDQPTLSDAFDYVTNGTVAPEGGHPEEKNPQLMKIDGSATSQYDVTPYISSGQGVERKMFTAGPGQMVASWYGEEWHNKLTSSGELYDMYSMTCAHKEFELGTILELTYAKTGKSVKVTVNNRGPYIEGRDIDMSYGAAMKLGSIQEGVIVVDYEVVGHDPKYNDYLRPTGEKPKLTILIESHISKQKSEHLQSRLRRFFQAVDIRQAKINGKTMYRVCVGHFRAEEQAKPVAERLLAKGYDALIIPIRD